MLLFLYTEEYSRSKTDEEDRWAKHVTILQRWDMGEENALHGVDEPSIPEFNELTLHVRMYIAGDTFLIDELTDTAMRIWRFRRA